MATKMFFPEYVCSALAADRTAQIQTMGAVCTYVFSQQQQDSSDTMSELGALLHKQAPHRSLKTWQNYAASSKRVVAQEQAAARLASLWQANPDPAAVAPLFASWLDREVTRKGYHTSSEDLSNWASGRLSIKAQAKADKAMAADKAVADAKAKDKAEQEARAEREAAAEIEANKPAPVPGAVPATPESGVVPESTGGLTAIDPTATAVDEQPVVVLRAVRKYPGGSTFDMTVDPALTADDLYGIASWLMGQADILAGVITTPASEETVAA